MSINLTISAAFEALFGYQSKALEPDFEQVVGHVASDTRKEYGTAGNTALYKNDAFGREYYLPISIT